MVKNVTLSRSSQISIKLCVIVKNDGIRGKIQNFVATTGMRVWSGAGDMLTIGQQKAPDASSTLCGFPLPSSLQMPTRTVAIMQPYFFPYLGYYALMARADVFVVFDCVQFPRRGRIHRCALPDRKGRPNWLTLPLARYGRTTRIADLRFAANAGDRWQAALDKYPWYISTEGRLTGTIRELLHIETDDVTAYLTRQFSAMRDLLGLHCRIVRSSAIPVDPGLHGQDRVIAIARALGASEYVNSPGGRALYDEARFRKAGIGLGFLPPYAGTVRHLLPALFTQDQDTLRADLRDYAAQPLIKGNPAHA